MPDAADPIFDLTPQALDAMAAHLVASGRYRLLRRFETCTLHPVGDPTIPKRGI